MSAALPVHDDELRLQIDVDRQLHRRLKLGHLLVPLRGLCWRAEPPFVVFVLVHVQHYAAR